MQKTAEKMVNMLDPDELRQLSKYHWAKYKKKYTRASEPNTPTGWRNWLIDLATVPYPRDSANYGKTFYNQLVPYTEGFLRFARDDVRAAFGLPSMTEVGTARDTLSYPKLPSVTEMWVKNPVKGPKWTQTKKDTYEGFATWK